MKKVASKDKSIQVSVVAMKPVGTISGAEEVVAGSLSAMKKGGFILESVNDVTINDFPAKHIVGVFRSDQYEGAYLADMNVIFSDVATVSILVSIDDARGGREVAASVLDWVSISGSPAVLSEGRSSPSTTFSIAEKIGYYAVWGVVGVAVVGVIRRGIARRKSNKGEFPPSA